MYKPYEKERLSVERHNGVRRGRLIASPSSLREDMSRTLKIILRETPTGRKATPWLEPQREKLARVAREVSEEMTDSKLRGAARVRAFNARVSQKLKKT